MRTLDDLIRRRKHRPQRVVLEVELMLRDSCGARLSTRPQEEQG
jgi:hypothetical protein